MSNSTLFATITTAVVFALGGWFVGNQSAKVTILKHAHKSKDCKGKDCEVTINFDCVDPAQAATCEPYAVEEVILVTPNHKIDFHIDKSTKHEFDAKGIEFTSANSGLFFPCKPDGKQKYSCTIETGAPPDLYKYAIRVKNMSEVDPWVVNN